MARTHASSLCMLVVSATGAACGDPFLPSDYAGPPAGAVNANVTAGSSAQKGALYPAISIEWLGDWRRSAGGNDPIAAAALYGQSLRYVRPLGAETDFRIDLTLPGPSAKLERDIGAGQVRVAVGKLVYFDDRTRDGQVNWYCRGSSCDIVKAVSNEFVVYLESSPTCRTRIDGRTRPSLDRGFHYFGMANLGGLPTEMPRDQALELSIKDRSPADSDPTAELLTFADAFFRMLTLDSLEGCQ